MKCRLDKYLSMSLNVTRQKAKELIKKKQISIDNIIAKKPEEKIDTEKQKITFQGNDVQYEPFAYYMLHKPADVVSATKDNLHQTVLDLIDDEVHTDLFPVGRLDIDTEGLLIITNDGQLGHDLTSPAKHIDKTYYVEVDGPLEEHHINKFQEGFDIGDEKPTKSATLEIISSDTKKSTCYVTISEGRYHQIKRMFLHFHLKVTYLKRIRMGTLRLDETLELGQYRKLTEDELFYLKGQHK